jgi:hypothetical protein
MIDNVSTQTLAESTIDRRQHERIAGPFDGLRIGALETPLRIFDLSRGGCFVNAMHEQRPGIRFVMKIQLPHVGLLSFNVETLYGRSGFGFAVRFVDMNEETAGLLDDELERLQELAPRADPSSAQVSVPLLPPVMAPVLDSSAAGISRDLRASRRAAEASAADRPRARRVAMLGSGYRAVIDGKHMALINLSLSGAQIRGPIRVLPDQPITVNIGWPQDELSCTAIARVRWVIVEPESSNDEEICRIGLAFETWDVRALREIMQHSARTFAPRSEINGPW